MVSDEFFDKSFDLLVIIFDAASILGGEDYIFDLFHLSRRSGEAALVEVSIDILSRPLADVEVRTLLDEILLGGISGDLRWHSGILILLHELGIARAAGGCRAIYGDHSRDRSADSFDARLDAALHECLTILNFDDILGISDLREVEFFGDLGANLGGIAIDSLAAADDQIILADLGNSSAQSVRSGEGIRPCESSIGEDDTSVGAAIHTFTNDFSGTSRTHREESHLRAGILFFKFQGLFEGIEILGVEDGGESGTVDSTILLHSILTDIASVGHLFGQNDDIKTHINYVRL